MIFQPKYSSKFLDFPISLLLIVALAPVMLLIGITVCLTSKGPVFYWSDRVGRSNVLFKMPKFRSMLVGTHAVATHLLDNPDAYLSPIGGFLRRSSLDELPQLFSVLKGDKPTYSFPLFLRFTVFDTTVETFSLVFISSKYSFGYFITYLKAL